MGQKAQAEASYSYQLDRQKQTVAMAADAARQKYHGVQTRMEQSRAAAAQDVANVQRAYTEAASSGRVAAVAGGVSGLSVTESQQDFSLRYVEAASSRFENQSWDEAQLSDHLGGIEAEQKGRVAGAQFGPVAQPNAMAAAFSVMGSVFDAYQIFPDSKMFKGWA